MNHRQAAIEAILFAAGDAVPLVQLCLALDQDAETVAADCALLRETYKTQQRGIQIIQIESQYQMVSSENCAHYIRKALDNQKIDRLSRPALEVLSIIAYHQPTTRAYVDQLRGVESAHTLSLLLDKEFIEECGRLEAPGNPILYRTTDIFLRTFQLTSLGDLPPIDGERGEDA